jgi:hypothetical protein
VNKPGIAYFYRMKTVIGNKINFTLEQRLDVVKRIEDIVREAGLSGQLRLVDWDAGMDFPVVHPITVIEQLPPVLRLRYLTLINRIIEVSL